MSLSSRNDKLLSAVLVGALVIEIVCLVAALDWLWILR